MLETKSIMTDQTDSSDNKRGFRRHNWTHAPKLWQIKTTETERKGEKSV